MLSEFSNATELPVGYQNLETATNIILGASSVGVMSNPRSYMRQITILQILISLLLLNVSYPIQVMYFLRIFKIGMFTFIPNPFLWIFPDLKFAKGYSPDRFQYANLSGIFLKDIGHLVAIFLLCIFMDLILNLMAAS